MSPAGLFSGGIGIWLLNVLLGLLLTVGGWFAARVTAKFDNHEVRIQSTERACVKLDNLIEDVRDMTTDTREIKADLRKIMIKTGVQ